MACPVVWVLAGWPRGNIATPRARAVPFPTVQLPRVLYRTGDVGSTSPCNEPLSPELPEEESLPSETSRRRGSAHSSRSWASATILCDSDCFRGWLCARWAALLRRYDVERYRSVLNPQPPSVGCTLLLMATGHWIHEP